MSDITEQEVMVHAASRDLILWDLLNKQTEIINQFNQSFDENRCAVLAGKIEAITIGINALLNSSAGAIFDGKLSDRSKPDLSIMDNVPKFGERHAS